MLGMVVPDNRNLYFAELARSVEDACFERGYNVILCNSDEDPAKESAYLSLLAEKRVDGIVFVASGTDRSGVQALVQHKIPVVALDRELKGMICDSIIVDNRDGGHQATWHLIGGNHRRIGCISGPKNLASAKERLQGYRDALAEARLPVEPALIQMGNFHIEGGYTAVQALLDLPNRVTAIFAANDLMAIGALRGIAARGLRVPEDVAVVGFDDIALAMYTEPPLTTDEQIFAAGALIRQFHDAARGSSLAGSCAVVCHLLKLEFSAVGRDSRTQEARLDLPETARAMLSAQRRIVMNRFWPKIDCI